MNKFSVLLFVALCGVSGTMSFVMKRASFRESCPPKPELIPELDISRYLGNWYQAQGIPSFFQPSSTTCIRATYGDMGPGKISVKNVGIFADEGFKEICGYAESTAEPGNLELNFPNTPKGSYWLLDTDYDNYAAVYTCSDIIGLIKFEYAWILTREQRPSAEVIDAARQVFTSKGISLDNFITVDQGDQCYYENPDGTTCESTH